TAAERCLRTLANVVGAQRGDEGQATTRPLGGSLGRAGRPLRWGSGTQSATGTATELRRVFFLGLDDRTARAGRRRGGRCLLAAEALLGDVVGLALGLFFALVTRLFLALPGVGRLALGFFCRVTLGANLGLFLGDPALFSLAQTGVAKGMSSAVALLI